MATIESVKRETATEAAIRGLEKYIIQADLQPGSRLMSENELCEKLQVSRIVVREAMQHFKSLGIIDSSPKRGAFIKQLHPEDPYRSYMPYMMRDPAAAREIAQMRAIIERGMIQEIVEKITPEHLALLEDINTKLLKASSKRRMELDIAFHSALLDIPGNRLLTGLRTLLYDFFQSTRMAGKYAPFNPEGNRKVYEEHQTMIQALRQKDAALLRSAIDAHIKEYRNNEL